MYPLKKTKKISACFFIALVFILLLMFPDISSLGVKSGINIMLYSLIPAILPFMIFSNFLIRSNYSHAIGRLVHPLFHRLFHTSINGSYAIVIGFLCGYPIGAKIINDLILKNKISKDEGTYLMGFINNPSPAFIQGYVLGTLGISHRYRIPILIYTYIPSIILGIIRGKKVKNSFSTPYDENKNYYPLSKILDDCVFDAIVTIIKLSGYIIIFSIISTFIYCIPILPKHIKNIFVCFPEITSGIHYLSKYPIPISIKLFFSLFLSITGGLSITFQIKSVISKSDLNISTYLKSKLFTLIIFSLMSLFIIAFI